MKTLIKQLAEIQSILNAPKNQFNKFGNYAYRSCEDISEALKPIMGDCAVVITDLVEMVGDRYYVKAIVKFTNGDNSIESSAYAREPLSQKGMSEPMLTGSASSYARKYALNAMFLIDDSKDADSIASRGQKTAVKKVDDNKDLLELIIKDPAKGKEAMADLDQATKKTVWAALTETQKKAVLEVKEGE